MSTEPAGPQPRPPARYGWIPDLPDHRDHVYSVPGHIAARLPSSVDRRDLCPGVYDQGQLGSCTGNAIAAAIECARKGAGKPTVTPSRLFIYYNERVIEHTVNTDAGAMIRDGIKTVVAKGVCAETTWPYQVNRFTVRPSSAAYTEAAADRASAYQRIGQNLSVMRGALAAGNPFVFGFTVYDSFESPKVAQTGVVNMPKSQESVLGGHAVLAVGYDDASSRFLVRNSWGPNWGMGGYFTLPYEYVTDAGLASDFWTITAIN